MGRSIIHSTPGPVVRRDRTRPDDVEREPHRDRIRLDPAARRPDHRALRRARHWWSLC